MHKAGSYSEASIASREIQTHIAHKSLTTSRFHEKAPTEINESPKPAVITLDSLTPCSNLENCM